MCREDRTNRAILLFCIALGFALPAFLLSEPAPGDPHPATRPTANSVHPIVDIPIRPIDPAASKSVSFSRDVMPVLRDTCWECHGSKDPESEFQAITVSTLLKGGEKNGPAVIPGQPDDSPIVKYIRGIKHPQMPKSEPVITADQLHVIRQWIAAGAADDSSDLASASADEALKNDPAAQAILGALASPGSPAEQAKRRRELRLQLLPPGPQPPTARGPVNNVLDSFILASWENAKLPEAANSPRLCDDATFLRRVYLDIIGVVPTIEQARQFAQDASPDKRARMIDQLLRATTTTRPTGPRSGRMRWGARHRRVSAESIPAVTTTSGSTRAFATMCRSIKWWRS